MTVISSCLFVFGNQRFISWASSLQGICGGQRDPCCSRRISCSRCTSRLERRRSRYYNVLVEAVECICGLHMDLHVANVNIALDFAKLLNETSLNERLVTSSIGATIISNKLISFIHACTHNLASLTAMLPLHPSFTTNTLCWPFFILPGFVLPETGFGAPLALT